MAETAAHMFGRLPGREFLQRIIDGALPPVGIGLTLGFRLVEVGEGFAAFEGETGAHQLNPIGTVHGGFALTLIDSATACAGHTLLPAGVGYTTLSTTGSLVRPILETTGRVRCEGQVINPGRQIITTEAAIKDDVGRLLAHGTSTLMVLQPRS